MIDHDPYTVADYGAMIVDPVRMDRYVRALEQAIKPGSVVIDIGTGTGVLALLACRCGARRVYAIEPGDVIQVGREIAAANGCADRIEFIQSMSTEVTLPERAAVIVSDLTGALPWYTHHIPSIVDARRRLLAADGVLIPRKDVAWAAIVDVGELYRRWTGPWNGAAADFDMDAATSINLTSANLVTAPQRWGETAYAAVEDANVQGQLAWTIVQPGTGHGFAAGFERTLADGVRMSNAPDQPATDRPSVYPTLFFPWPEPVRLELGDRITLQLAGNLMRQDYLWTWNTQIVDQHGAQKRAFGQSTFYGSPVSPASLRRNAASRVAPLNEEGQVARFALEAMDAGVPLGDIARRIAADFPRRFERPHEALEFVVDLSRRYS